MKGLYSSYPFLFGFIYLILLIELARLLETSAVFFLSLVILSAVLISKQKSLSNFLSGLYGDDPGDDSYIDRTDILLKKFTGLSAWLIIIMLIITAVMLIRWDLIQRHNTGYFLAGLSGRTIVAEVIGFERQSYILRTRTFYDKSFYPDLFSVLISLNTTSELDKGTVLEVPADSINPREYDPEEVSASARNITAGNYYTASDFNVLEVENPDSSRFTFSLNNLRSLLSGYLDKHFHEEEANLLRALLLGMRDNTGEMAALMRRAGVGHLLALSGLHIGYITIFSLGFLRGLSGITGIDKVKYLSLPFILGYVFLAGASPSLLRAGIMSSVWIILLSVEQKTASLNVLGLTGILVLILNPYYLYLISFQLSFLVVTSLLIYLPRLRNLSPVKFTPFLLSLTAQLGSQPLLLRISGVFNLNGLAANLILVPLLGPILFINLIFLLAAPFNFRAASLLARLSSFMLAPFFYLTEIMSSLPLYFESEFLREAESFSFLPETLMFSPLLSFYILLFILPHYLERIRVGRKLCSRKMINFRSISLDVFLLFNFLHIAAFLFRQLGKI